MRAHVRSAQGATRRSPVSRIRQGRHTLAAAAALAAVVAVWPAAATPLTRTQELAPLPGDAAALPGGFGQGMNAAGHIVGTSAASVDDGGALSAVIWHRPEGPPVRLAPLPTDPNSRANAINARGQVVGNSGVDPWSAPGESQAVLWEPDGRVRALPAPPGMVHAGAWGINARGQVVGRAYDASGQQAVRWEPDGSVTVLRPPVAHSPAGHFTIASSINEAGASVGTYSAAGVRSPVRWDAEGTGVDLATLPEYSTGQAWAINNRGEVAGTLYAGTASWERLAVRWDASGALRTLEPLPGDPWSSATGISESGTVAGASISEDRLLRPVVWMRGSASPTPLEIPAGYAQATAVSVSARGEVLVWAWNRLSGASYRPGDVGVFLIG